MTMLVTDEEQAILDRLAFSGLGPAGDCVHRRMYDVLYCTPAVTMLFAYGRRVCVPCEVSWNGDRFCWMCQRPGVTVSEFRRKRWMSRDEVV